jgi:hypothetical protein
LRNLLIVPPGSGIVHQVNLEYLARVVFADDSGSRREKPMLYCDSLVGTDSHTTMINGLGIVGWGVGGEDSETPRMDETSPDDSYCYMYVNLRYRGRGGHARTGHFHGTSSCHRVQDSWRNACYGNVDRSRAVHNEGK